MSELKDAIDPRSIRLTAQNFTFMAILDGVHTPATPPHVPSPACPYGARHLTARGETEVDRRAEQFGEVVIALASSGARRSVWSQAGVAASARIDCYVCGLVESSASAEDPTSVDAARRRSGALCRVPPT
jgi:hypothetical protein